MPHSRGELIFRTDSIVGLLARITTLACVLGVAGTTALVLFPSLRQSIGWQTDSIDYAVGDRIDLAPELFESSNRTVVLFLRSTCPACQDNSAMLERLVAESSAAVDTRVVMVTGQGARDSEVRFAEELGLDARQVVPLDLRRLRLRHVPSAVVVDRDGTVLFSRSGPISEQDLESVKRLVGTP
jgi:hypothetical protein